MTYPTTFNNLAAGNQSLSLFDTMFQIVGQQGIIPCTPSGTNAITLTPGTNYYAPTALTNGMCVSFLAANTSTAGVAVQLLALGSLSLYTTLGALATAGDIAAGSHYVLQYWSDLNSNAGGWLIVNSNGSHVGYGPPGEGIGSTVTQTAAQTNGVTINAMCGSITMATATGSTSWQRFPVTNSFVSATDVILVNSKIVGNGRYLMLVSAVSTGAFDVSFSTTAPPVGADNPIVNFAVIKAVAS